MANTKSAEKRNRQAIKRNARNSAVKTASLAWEASVWAFATSCATSSTLDSVWHVGSMFK